MGQPMPWLMFTLRNVSTCKYQLRQKCAPSSSLVCPWSASEEPRGDESQVQAISEQDGVPKEQGGDPGGGWIQLDLPMEQALYLQNYASDLQAVFTEG